MHTHIYTYTYTYAGAQGPDEGHYIIEKILRQRRPADQREALPTRERN